MSNELISIVTPLCNEEGNIDELYRRIVESLGDVSFELLFVDDGSRDRSWARIETLASQDIRIRGLQLSRNFGHQAALTAGLKNVHGDAVVVIDSDLQDPPEIIPSMIAKWHNGYDVVYGVRTKREGEGIFKRLSAWLFYRCFRTASKLDMPVEAGDFRLMSKRVVAILNEAPERIRFLRGLSAWVGFKQTGITYDRDSRRSGKTKYPTLTMFKFAFDGLTSFSTAPLKMTSGLGMIVTSIACLVGMHALYVKLVSGTAVPGWTSLLIVIVFLGGVQLITIGIIGEYIGRIYAEVKQRPIFLVNRTIGVEQKEEARISL